MLAGRSVGLHWPMKLVATASGWRAGSLLAGSRRMSSIRRALLRRAPERLACLRTAEGTGLPANIIEELRRDMARLALVREQISSIEKTRAERLERAPNTGPHAMVRLLSRVIGIGIETADMLVREILSRKLREERWRATPGSPDRPTTAA